MPLTRAGRSAYIDPMFQIKYLHALWGMPLPTLEANLRRIQEGGFDGVEMGVPADGAQRRELKTLLEIGRAHV